MTTHRVLDFHDFWPVFCTWCAARRVFAADTYPNHNRHRVYCAVCDAGLVKFGMSRSPEGRAEGLTASMGRVFGEHRILFEVTRSGPALERAVHSILVPWRYASEWYLPDESLWDLVWGAWAHGVADGGPVHTVGSVAFDSRVSMPGMVWETKKLLGCTKSDIERWRSGNHLPQPPMMHRISKRLGIPILSWIKPVAPQAVSATAATKAA